MSSPIVLVLGASGQVGGAAAADLLPAHRAGTIRLAVAGRDPAKLAAFAADGVEIRRLDLDAAERHGLEAIRPAFSGVERLLLLTGYGFDMVEQSKAALDAAKKAGVRHVVHVGACGDDDTTVAHWAWHQLIERYAEWHGFGFTHLRPEWFMQNLLSALGPTGLTSYIGAARVAWVDARDVGAVAADALLRPERHANVVRRLAAEVWSLPLVAEVVSAEVGRPVPVVHRTPAEFLAATVAAGGDPTYFRCIENQFTRNAEGSIAGADQTHGDFPALIGRPARSIGAFVAEHRDAIRRALGGPSGDTERMHSN